MGTVRSAPRAGRGNSGRAALAAAVVPATPRQAAPSLADALRSYVRVAREEGLGTEAMLAELERAWCGRRTRAAGVRLTRDVMEVAVLLELSACEEGTSARLAG
jgi:hypothetical protein